MIEAFVYWAISVIAAGLILVVVILATVDRD